MKMPYITGTRVLLSVNIPRLKRHLERPLEDSDALGSNVIKQQWSVSIQNSNLASSSWMSFSEYWGVFLERPCVLPSEVSSAPAIECAVYWMSLSHRILEGACSIVTLLPATWQGFRDFPQSLQGNSRMRETVTTAKVFRYLSSSLSYL
jgi:hypothetical protein